jgi:hypothetical protein
LLRRQRHLRKKLDVFGPACPATAGFVSRLQKYFPVTFHPTPQVTLHVDLSVYAGSQPRVFPLLSQVFVVGETVDSLSTKFWDAYQSFIRQNWWHGYRGGRAA